MLIVTNFGYFTSVIQLHDVMMNDGISTVDGFIYHQDMKRAFKLSLSEVSDICFKK